MKKDSLEYFNNHLIDALNHYPNLRGVLDENGEPYIRGILDIPNDNREVVGHFLIEIKCSFRYPFRFPHLFEVGGEIPNVSDRHKYPNSKCCITVEADEIVQCKHGITLVRFISEFAIPYFANQIYYNLTGRYRNGEYSHGEHGIIQYYRSLMKTSDRNLWLTYIKYAFKAQKVPCGRNDICFCGGELKYKCCHLKVFETLVKIGESQVLKDIKIRIE